MHHSESSASKHLGGHRLTDGVYLETDLAKSGVVEDVTSVEEERRLRHGIVYPFVVERLELVPLGQNRNRVRPLGRRVRVGAGDEVVLEARHALRSHLQRVRKLHKHDTALDLRVVHVHLGLLLQQVAAHKRRSGLTGVSGILLEGEAVDRDLLAGDGVEHRLDDLHREPLLLVLVHFNHLVPVLGALVEAEGLAEVHKVEDVLLEARPAEAHRRVQELRADARVRADRARDLRDVGIRRFAEGRDRVDAGYALGKYGVGHELGELRRPEVGGDDLRARDPLRVHTCESLDGREALRGLLTANQHASRVLQVVHGGALGEELWVRQHLESDAVLRRRGEHTLDGVGGADRHRRLLHHNLVGGGDLGDLTGTELAVLDVGRAARADTLGLGRGVDRDEDDVGLCDGLVDGGREEHVLAAHRLHDLEESRLEDGEVVRVPGTDLLLGNVHHSHLDVRAVGGNDGHGGTADVASAHAADLKLIVGGRHGKNRAVIPIASQKLC
mmetsp:Transcript_26117/g.61216  ORF Transcript_26117/g.61216 Transcript_26117/m.61216 type:complete len:500 (+) Transcript_26117:98-1597(+)